MPANYSPLQGSQPHVLWSPPLWLPSGSPNRRLERADRPAVVTPQLKLRILTTGIRNCEGRLLSNVASPLASKIFGIALKSESLQGRPADGQYSIGKWQGEEVQIDGFIRPSILAKNFKFDGAGVVGPVLLYIPGYPVDLIGGDGGTNFVCRSIHPGLWDKFIAPCIGNNSNRGIGIIGINNFKIEVQYIGARPLGNSTNRRLRDNISVYQSLCTISTFPESELTIATLNQITLWGKCSS